MMRERAPSSVFHLDTYRIRSGYYTDQYFNRTKALVAKFRPDTVVKMQVFQKNHAVLGGIDEAISILRECSGEWEYPLGSNDSWCSRQPGLGQLKVHALREVDADRKSTRLNSSHANISYA